MHLHDRAGTLASKYIYINSIGVRVHFNFSSISITSSGIVRIYQATHSCLCYNLYIYTTLTP